MVRRRAHGNPIHLLVQIFCKLGKVFSFFVMLRTYLLLKPLPSLSLLGFRCFISLCFLLNAEWNPPFTHFYDGTEWCTLCWLHEPTLSSAWGGTQAIKTRQSRKGRTRKGSRDHRKKFQDSEEMSERTGLFDLWNAFCSRTWTKTEQT